MLLLREEQVKQKVIDVSRVVEEELAQYKGAFPANPGKKYPGFGDEFSFELSKPYSVGQRFTAKELYEKIRVAFAAHNLEDIPFEFGLATLFNGQFIMSRQSDNFQTWYS